MAEKILRRPEVSERTGLSKSTLYLLIKRNEFPAPMPLTGMRRGPHVSAVGWPESTVTAWIEQRIAAASLERAAA